MEVIIIPGFLGYSEETHFIDLQVKFKNAGAKLTVLDWPNLPEPITEYSMTNALNYFRSILETKNCANIVLMGFSLGGVIATVLASEFAFKKLVLVHSPIQFAKNDAITPLMETWKEQGEFTFKSSKFGEVKLLYNFVKDALQYNCIELIAKVICPKLIISGTEDRTVPTAETRKIFDLAAEPREWLLIEGMQHKYKEQPELMKLLNGKIVEWAMK